METVLNFFLFGVGIVVILGLFEVVINSSSIIGYFLECRHREKMEELRIKLLKETDTHVVAP